MYFLYSNQVAAPSHITGVPAKVYRCIQCFYASLKIVYFHTPILHSTSMLLIPCHVYTGIFISCSIRGTQKASTEASTKSRETTLTKEATDEN